MIWVTNQWIAGDVKMFKKITVLLIAVILLTACGIENNKGSRLPADNGSLPEAGDDVKKIEIIDNTAGVNKNDEWIMVPTIPPSDMDTDAQKPFNDVLLNQEQTIKLFMDAWEQNDLEKMNMLTVQPLEEFFRQSDINFASYGHLERGDLLGFARDGMNRIKEYNARAIKDVKIEGVSRDGDKAKVDMGKGFDFNVTFALDQNMWKLERIVAEITGLESVEPEELDTLGQLVLVDVRDMNSDGYYELLTMGFRGEWEGIGPEPTSAIGIYKNHDKGISNIYFRDMNERLKEDRVVLEGGMGKVLDDQPVLLVLIEKTAQDNLAILEGPAPQYYVSLYRLERNNLIKVGEVDWEGTVTDVLENRIVPEWVELIGVKRFKKGAAESIVLRVGFRDRSDGDDAYQTNEGIFILSHDRGRWHTDWHHEGTHGEYHTVVFQGNNSPELPAKMYYIEDANYYGGKGAGVFEVYYKKDRWVSEGIFSEKLNIKAAGDITGDGNIEFLVFDGSNLKVCTRDGELLWNIRPPGGTKEVPHAWIGNVKGRQRIIAAFHIGDYVDMSGRICVWEEQNGLMRQIWQSDVLGSDGITAMLIWDLDMDGVPEILVNYTDDYLLWGQFFKIFEP